jgi:hypothetical protein
VSGVAGAELVPTYSDDGRLHMAVVLNDLGEPVHTLQRVIHSV